jgi:hypothetical protein
MHPFTGNKGSMPYTGKMLNKWHSHFLEETNIYRKNFLSWHFLLVTGTAFPVKGGKERTKQHSSLKTGLPDPSSAHCFLSKQDPLRYSTMINSHS